MNFICDHPAIKAISFVGSNQAGEYIYERGSKNGKRVQSNMVGPEHEVNEFTENQTAYESMFSYKQQNHT